MDQFSKFLDEDVDETLHSGAAVDALTAALNREVGGAVPQNGGSKPKDLTESSQTGQNPSSESQQSDKTKPKPDPVPKQADSQALPRQQMQSVPANQQAPAGSSSAEKKAAPKAAPTIPFQMLMPILRPHLDKDRDMQLQQIFTKLRSNEVSKEDFLRVIRNIVGDQMLRQAAHTVHMKMQSDSLKASSQPTPAPTPNPNSTSSASSTNPNPNPPNPNPNPNSYSLLSQTSSSSQQFYHQRPSLGASPSPSQLQTLDSKPATSALNPKPATSNPKPMQTLSRPPHHNMFGPSFPSRPPHQQPQPPTRPLTGQVAGSNWPRGVGSTFGPAYVKQEQTDGNKQNSGPPLRDDFLNRGLPRIGAPGPGPPAVISGPGPQVSQADLSMQTPVKGAVKKPAVGQKKPMEAAGSSPNPASKKQKTGGHLDQSIEQLNDVTAVSGVNLREEEEQLLSAPKEDSRISEATRRVVQEEEERLILQRGPLHKKLKEILAKNNLSGVGSDVERCLSMCVEERLKGIIGSLIRISKQRVDVEKSAHKVVVSSDVHTHILNENRKAKEEWDRKQAEEAEKLKKQNEVDGSSGAEGDKDKDEKNSSKNIKVNKEEDDKMRTTAANVAARAAVGGDDMLTKWQMMAEQARQKREGLDSAAPKTSGPKPPLNKSREQSDAEGKGTGGKGEEGVKRSVGLRDVIAVLEREPDMGRSGLVYRLYDRVGE